MRAKLIFAYMNFPDGAFAFTIEFFRDYTKFSMLALKAYTEDRKKNQQKSSLQ